VTPHIIEFTTATRSSSASPFPKPRRRSCGPSTRSRSSPSQLDCYRACTGRPDPPRAPFGDVAVVAGARSGKDSRIAGPIVCYEALFRGHEHHLARGERRVIALVAQDARATRVAFSYVKDYLTGSRLLGGAWWRRCSPRRSRS
jgi:hypothetical protein